MNPATVYCSSCIRPLWRLAVLSNGQPVTIPASIEVPSYRDGMTQCPFCQQEIYIERSGYHLSLVRDDLSGYLRVS